jgi:hypothetical protein
MTQEEQIKLMQLRQVLVRLYQTVAAQNPPLGDGRIKDDLEKALQLSEQLTSD